MLRFPRAIKWRAEEKPAEHSCHLEGSDRRNTVPQPPSCPWPAASEMMERCTVSSVHVPSQACWRSLSRYLEEGAQGKGCGQPVALVGQALCLCAGQDGVSQPQSSDVHLFRADSSPNQLKPPDSTQTMSSPEEQDEAKRKECAPLLVATELPSAAGTRPAAMRQQACRWSHWQTPHAVSAGSADGEQWRHPAKNYSIIRAQLLYSSSLLQRKRKTYMLLGNMVWQDAHLQSSQECFLIGVQASPLVQLAASRAGRLHVAPPAHEPLLCGCLHVPLPLVA